MIRQELLDPRRFGNHLVRGLHGWKQLLTDYVENGGIFTNGDIDQLIAYDEWFNAIMNRIIEDTEKFDRGQ